MENYSSNNSKTIIRKYLKVFLIFIAVCFVVAILYFTGASKYLLGSLLNGWPISSSTSINYAYGENIGWVDFNPADFSTGVGVKVGDNGLTGYAWGENVGWIKFGNDIGPDSVNGYLNNSSSNWGVNNDGSGNLSGYAWGENVGWISFSGTSPNYGVTINTATGAFSGWAWGENVGWISFNCSNSGGSCSPSWGVVTDWRPPVNGVCGSANGGNVTSAPTSNLCSVGDATTVTGAGPWAWTCPGSHGGTTDSCSATLSNTGGGGSGGSVLLLNGQNSTSTQTPATWCHDFNTSLGWDQSGTAEIIQLHTALQKEGISYAPDTGNIYDMGTSQAVIQFQTKYGITPQTGYTGIKTRTKLNQLYGCTPTINSTTQQSDVLDYIKQNLEKIKQSLPQGSPTFTQPTTPPPSNLQPTQPPSTQTQPQNQNLIIQILNKMLKLLKDLLDTISK